MTFTGEFDAFAADIPGFADGESLEDYIRGEQFDAYDKNRDELVCIHSIPGAGAVS